MGKGKGPTASLDEFLAAYDEDDAIWWRISCGHHQNLFEMAVEELLAKRALLDVLRTGGHLTPEAQAAMDDVEGLM